MGEYSRFLTSLFRNLALEAAWSAPLEYLFDEFLKSLKRLLQFVGYGTQELGQELLATTKKVSEYLEKRFDELDEVKNLSTKPDNQFQDGFCGNLHA